MHNLSMTLLYSLLYNYHLPISRPDTLLQAAHKSDVSVLLYACLDI